MPDVELMAVPESEFTDYSPRSVKRILSRLGIRPSRRRGQSFLVSAGAAREIIDLAGLKENDAVLEIGPGLGALTAGLLQRAGRVVAVESDRRLASWLRKRFAADVDLTVVEADALKIDLGRLLSGSTGRGGSIRVVSNIPYSVSTPLIAKLLKEVADAAAFVLTVQRELAGRITARPGGKVYGAFTIFCRYHAEVERAFALPAAAFYPRPAVDSTVLVFRPRKRPPFALSDERAFFSLVRLLFSHRRKMVKTILRKAMPARPDEDKVLRILSSLGIDPSLRPERLSPDQLGRLFNDLLGSGLLKPGTL